MIVAPVARDVNSQKMMNWSYRSAFRALCHHAKAQSPRNEHAHQLDFRPFSEEMTRDCFAFPFAYLA